MTNTPNPERYAGHVEHPRYGRAPRHTGLDPDPDSLHVHLHWNTRRFTEKQLREMERCLGWLPVFPDDGARWVPGTAVPADLARQTPATVPVTHYYDLDKLCRDCGRRFLFFAEEQKHWYEELGFPLEADAVRCVECRASARGIARLRARYEALCHVPERGVEETWEMAECCLELIAEGVFSPRQTEHVRMLLNRVPEERRLARRHLKLQSRLREVEGTARGEEG